MAEDKHVQLWETPATEFLTAVNETLGGEHKFTQLIDMIFVGTCSRGHGRGFFQLTAREFGNLQEGHFGPILKRNPEAKTILVISECCGQYHEHFQEALRLEHPEITWVFPEHSDYCDHKTVEKVARDLINAKLLS